MTRASYQVASDLDLFSHALLEDPYPVLRELRDLGGAVYMWQHDFYVLTRYEDVRAAVRDWRTFTSARGTGLVPELNAGQIGGVIATDPPEHDSLRAVLSEQVSPRAVNKLRGDIGQQAAERTPQSHSLPRCSLTHRSRRSS
jgi:cytochrome P450